MTIQANVSAYKGLRQLGGLVPMARKNKDGTEELMINNEGFVQLTDGRGFVTNSLLRKDEWELLDEAVQIAATGQLNAIDRLNGMPILRKQLNSIGDGQPV